MIYEFGRRPKKLANLLNNKHTCSNYAIWKYYESENNHITARWLNLSPLAELAGVREVNWWREGFHTFDATNRQDRAFELAH